MKAKPVITKQDCKQHGIPKKKCAECVRHEIPWDTCTAIREPFITWKDCRKHRIPKTKCADCFMFNIPADVCEHVITPDDAELIIEQRFGAGGKAIVHKASLKMEGEKPVTVMARMTIEFISSTAFMARSKDDRPEGTTYQTTE